MDLNIEGTGEVMGWSPPIGEVLSPGFEATSEALSEVYGGLTLREARLKQVRRFIDKLEEKGYCIAKYEP